MKLVFKLPWLLLFMAMLNACAKKPSSISNSEGFNQPEHAQGFEYKTSDSLIVLSLFHPIKNQKEIISIPKPLSNQRWVCLSTTHLGYIKALNAENQIVGIAGIETIYDQGLYTKVKQGIITDVGNVNAIRREVLYALTPSIVFNYAIKDVNMSSLGDNNRYPFQELIISEYMETSPLAKAEWIKIFGILTGKKTLADSVFRDINSQYTQLTKIAGKGVRPKIMTGIPYHGTWYVPGGESYLAKLIDDAGGDYLFKHKPGSASHPLSIEEVIQRCQDADIWLNPDLLESYAQIPAIDSRLTTIRAYQQNRIYNHNQRVSHNGGNDYYESGVVHPERILKDLIMIFHPEVMKDTLYYYKELGRP